MLQVDFEKAFDRVYMYSREARARVRINGGSNHDHGFLKRSFSVLSDAIVRQYAMPEGQLSLTINMNDRW